MADQSNSLSETAKSTKVDGCNSRRTSMGKPSSSGKGEKVLPLYLRASTGSCHDFCKYGKKHDSEEKARRSFPRRITKKPPDDQSIEFQLEKNKTQVVELKSSSDSKIHSPITPEIIKCELPTESVDRKTSVSFEVLARKKTSTGSLLNKSFDSQSPVLREVLAKKKTLAGLSLTKSFDSQSSVLRDALAKRKTSKQAVLTDSVDGQNSVASESCVEKKKASVQGTRTTSVGHLRTSPASKTHISTKILKQDISSSDKPESPLKKASSKAKQVNLYTKPKGASSLKPKFSSSAVSKVSSGRQKSDVKMGKKTGTPKITLRRVKNSPRASLSLQNSCEVSRSVASPRASLSGKLSLIKVASLNAKKHGGLRVLSPLKSQRKFKRADTEQSKGKNADSDQPAGDLKDPNDVVVQEKTLYVIKMEADGKYLEIGHNGNLSVESCPSLLSSPESPSLPKSPSLSYHDGEEEEESEYTVTDEEDELLSEHDETKHMEEVEILEEHKRKHRKPRMATSEDKDSQPVKLHFRRGRVVDIQSENNGPRRLKFRRGRMLGENQYIKADGRKNFKRRGADDNLNDGKPDSEKVVLRHQDLHGKKDAKGLFNNVIEETASKLVETRKSKVKALVGAFETVISLQDSKPSANALS